MPPSIKIDFKYAEIEFKQTIIIICKSYNTWLIIYRHGESTCHTVIKKQAIFLSGYVEVINFLFLTLLLISRYEVFFLLHKIEDNNNKFMKQLNKNF